MRRGLSLAQVMSPQDAKRMLARVSHFQRSAASRRPTAGGYGKYFFPRFIRKNIFKPLRRIFLGREPLGSRQRHVPAGSDYLVSSNNTVSDALTPLSEGSLIDPKKSTPPPPVKSATYSTPLGTPEDKSGFISGSSTPSRPLSTALDTKEILHRLESMDRRSSKEIGRLIEVVKVADKNNVSIPSLMYSKFAYTVAPIAKALGLTPGQILVGLAVTGGITGPALTAALSGREVGQKPGFGEITKSGRRGV